jgi:hypothetical protein
VRVIYVLVVHVPSEGVDSFQRYELAVLPLLSEYEGSLERRLRSEDQQTEVHLVSFPSAEHFARYRDDPRQASHSRLLDEANAQIELYELREVPD